MEKCTKYGRQGPANLRYCNRCNNHKNCEYLQLLEQKRPKPKLPLYTVDTYITIKGVGVGVTL